MRPHDAVDPSEAYAVVSEATFQRHVIHLAHSLGCDVYHHTTVGARCGQCGYRMRGGRIVTSKGFPDLIIARLDPPLLIYAELKSQKGRLSPDQRRWRDVLQANGQRWYLWRPSDWTEIEEVLAA